MDTTTILKSIGKRNATVNLRRCTQVKHVFVLFQGAGPANGTTQGAQTYYQGIPPSFPPPHFHSNIPPGHPSHVPSPTHPGHSPPPSHGYYKDERAQRQYFKLKKKLHDKQQKGDSALSSPRKDLVNGLRRGKEKGMNSVGTSEDGEESSSVQDEEDSVQIITDMLSSVQAPKVKKQYLQGRVLAFGCS